MKDTKHTPGPWSIDEHGQIIDDNSVIGRVYCGDVFPNDELPECTANARLIAAAPELLEASSELLDAMNQYSFFLEGYGNGSASISEVREASSKMTDAQHKLFDVIQKAKGL